MRSACAMESEASKSECDGLRQDNEACFIAAVFSIMWCE
uniref:Uncharacterized protein n=1 Tax=Mesocestoides corti TaxID=53468 RepID=A0A5K3ELR3_MESCO